MWGTEGCHAEEVADGDKSCLLVSEAEIQGGWKNELELRRQKRRLGTTLWRSFAIKLGRAMGQ